MSPDQERAILDWLLHKGLYGLSEDALLLGFCQRCTQAGDRRQAGRRHMGRRDVDHATVIDQFGQRIARRAGEQEDEMAHQLLRAAAVCCTGGQLRAVGRDQGQHGTIGAQ